MGEILNRSSCHAPRSERMGTYRRLGYMPGVIILDLDTEAETLLEEPPAYAMR